MCLVGHQERCVSLRSQTVTIAAISSRHPHDLISRLPVYTPLCILYKPCAVAADPQKVSWKEDGCVTVQVGDRETECLCNHLTYFTILVVSCLGDGMYLCVSF